MTSELDYKGKLRTELKHIHSGDIILTDAPKDNHGNGEAFSPTDLAATSLGSCMLTVMGIKANAIEANIDGMTATVEKIMGTAPRRITQININIQFPKQSYTDKQKDSLELTGINCPVAKSLHPDIIQNINFKY